MKYLYAASVKCVVGIVCLCSLCAAQTTEPSPPMSGAQIEFVARIDAALLRTAAYLTATQSPDGAWRSQTYGFFRDGMSLTPYVMSALFFLPGTEARTAFRRGVDYLTGMVNESGELQGDARKLMFPVLSAASASRMVVLETKDDLHKRAQAAYLGVVRQWQLTESLGWSPDDAEYGGWGFALRPPRKARSGEWKEPFAESNMVATIFGIAALRSARIPLSDPAWEKTLAFVKRCQNFSDDPAKIDPQFDDGGFFFIPNDPAQNKAGIAGTDRFGRQRFYSYGTMTADGLRALLQCGLPKDHPRVIAAKAWLQRNFSVTDNPGTFAPDREVLRNATYYYWVWSVAHAFQRAGVTVIEQHGERVNWAETLTAELLRRQLPDGTWINRYTDAKEDDPLVATSWAAAALAICRSVLLEKSSREVIPPA